MRKKITEEVSLATKVIMPALGLAQEYGILVNWLKKEGEQVTHGESIMEVETDKATVEVEASASGILAGCSAQPGNTVPVGTTIAWILEIGESLPNSEVVHPQMPPLFSGQQEKVHVTASPVARKMAQELSINLGEIIPRSNRIEKADVLAYVAAKKQSPAPSIQAIHPRLTPASPKARRLANSLNLNVTDLAGSGPDGAVLEADLLAAKTNIHSLTPINLSNTWQIMAQRVSESWNSAPHIYLLRDANASRLVAWRKQAEVRFGQKITYTDLLVRLVATALREHPRLNAFVKEGQVFPQAEINMGLAVAASNGLVVPVIHHADELTLEQIAARDRDLVARAHAGKLHPDDLQRGTFTLSNLGMFGVDVFFAIINPPQAAILAVGRIADRVVPMNGIPSVQQMMTLSLSCDHRALDGALGARFLEFLVNLIEEPLVLLN